MKSQVKIHLAASLAFAACVVFTLPRTHAQPEAPPESVAPAQDIEILRNHSLLARYATEYFTAIARTEAGYLPVVTFFRGRAEAYGEAYRLLGGTLPL